jgi:hypothetical protein
MPSAQGGWIVTRIRQGRGSGRTARWFAASGCRPAWQGRRGAGRWFHASDRRRGPIGRPHADVHLVVCARRPWWSPLAGGRRTGHGCCGRCWRRQRKGALVAASQVGRSGLMNDLALPCKSPSDGGLSRSWIGPGCGVGADRSGRSCDHQPCLRRSLAISTILAPGQRVAGASKGPLLICSRPAAPYGATSAAPGGDPVALQPGLPFALLDQPRLAPGLGSIPTDQAVCATPLRGRKRGRLLVRGEEATRMGRHGNRLAKICARSTA